MDRRIFAVRDFNATAGEDSIRLSCSVCDDHGDDSQLWYEIHGLPRGVSFASADAFFAPCLLFAMKRNAAIRFEVPISDRIAQQAPDLAFIFGTQLGLDRHPQIDFPNVVIITRQSRGGVMGFSSGVDSWFSLKENFFECDFPSKRVTYLLVNDVGANTLDPKKRQVLSRAQDVASDLGLRLGHVSSNMAHFLGMGFQKTHTARNASVAHLFAPVTDTFYYSSTDTYLDAGVFPTYDMAYADSILLPLLSSDAMHLRSSGSCFTRGAKTEGILNIPRIGEHLDVCVNHGHQSSKINCGRCWKCMRTELTLEAFGALAQFEPVFDLNAYRKYRQRYIRTISLSAKPTEREAFDLARKAGLVGPRFLYLPQEAATRAARWLKNTGKRAVRKIGRLARAT